MLSVRGCICPVFFQRNSFVFTVHPEPLWKGQTSSECDRLKAPNDIGMSNFETLSKSDVIMNQLFVEFKKFVCIIKKRNEELFLLPIHEI